MTFGFIDFLFSPFLYLGHNQTLSTEKAQHSSRREECADTGAGWGPRATGSPHSSTSTKCLVAWDCGPCKALEGQAGACSHDMGVQKSTVTQPQPPQAPFPQVTFLYYHQGNPSLEFIPCCTEVHRWDSCPRSCVPAPPPLSLLTDAV